MKKTERFPEHMCITRACDTPEEYLEKFAGPIHRLSECAEDMLRNMVIDPASECVKLVKVTPPDLGLSDGGTCEAVLKAAQEQGLEPCPAWVGTQYRLDCTEAEYTTIGMEPIHDSPDDSGVFFVGYRMDGLWLCSCGVGQHWGPSSNWIFVSST